ncbi:hypothetical protein SEPCBS119000_000638 [Sporothrix epigloea]|uniref:Peroxidase n=1 Tax=Sporothrix epigloea TaxID=1892477 RepID=A0ABP0D7V5_9PEZI
MLPPSLSFAVLALGTAVYAKASFHAALQDIHIYARQQDGNATGPSTVLLADLATGGAVTPSGEIIRSILQNTAPATVDNSIVYTRPAAVANRGQGGLDSVACRQDTCCVWSYIVAPMNTSVTVPDFAQDGSVGSGGADGSLLLSAGELQRSENRGMGNYADLMLSWRNAFSRYAPGLTVADLIQVGATVATVTCPGGPRIRTFVGRPDVDGRIPPPAQHLLPSPDSSAATILELFAAKTFSATDVVALAGAHTVSHQYVTEPRYAGAPQDTTDGVFDSRFYAETEAAVPPAGIYSFQSDKQLSTDAATQSLWSQYAQPDAQTKWAEEYATAYFRLSLLGVQKLNGLTDCSGVLPLAKPVP